MRRSLIALAPVLSLLLAATPALAAPADSIAYATRVCAANLVGVTLTNYGILGNDFASRAASLEYPLGTGYEHLPLGGLWIGAVGDDALGAFTGVTCAMLDPNVGLSTPGFTEFTPAGLDLARRSTLPGGAYFAPDAVSELDHVATFSDRPARRASGASEDHRPLGLRVRQESYAWSLADLSHVVFLRYVIKTDSPLSAVHVGLYIELASGPRNAYTTWPPTSSGSPYGSWWNKALLAWDGSLRLLREHRCSGYPIPAGCAFAVTPAWMGVQLLTPPDPAQGQHVTLGAWGFAPGTPVRDEDGERYALMSAGTLDPLTSPDVMPVSGDPMTLLSIGPFASLALGDSLVVDFALVGGAEVADIQAHAAGAQLLRDRDFALPVPVTAALADARADRDRVALTWQLSGSGAGALAVERRTSDSDWRTVGSTTTDGEGYARFEDRAVTGGTRYGFRLVPAGPVQPLGEVWIQVPGTLGFALRGPLVNPAPDDDLRVAFALETDAPGTLELIDIAGRRVESRPLAGLGAGEHVVRMAPRAPGVYLLRLTQGERSARARVVVTR